MAKQHHVPPSKVRLPMGNQLVDVSGSSWWWSPRWSHPCSGTHRIVRALETHLPGHGRKAAAGRGDVCPDRELHG